MVESFDDGGIIPEMEIESQSLESEPYDLQETFDEDYEKFSNGEKGFGERDLSEMREDLPETYENWNEMDNEKQQEAWSKFSDENKDKYLDCVENEPIITKDAQEVAKNNDGDLQGMEYRLGGGIRLRKK